VEPPNNGHVGTRYFVLYREVVLSSEVKNVFYMGKRWFSVNGLGLGQVPMFKEKEVWCITLVYSRLDDNVQLQ